MMFQHEYEVRPRKDHRGVDLISDALPFGRLWLHRAGGRNRIREVSQPDVDAIINNVRVTKYCFR